MRVRHDSHIRFESGKKLKIRWAKPEASNNSAEDQAARIKAAVGPSHFNWNPETLNVISKCES